MLYSLAFLSLLSAWLVWLSSTDSLHLVLLWMHALRLDIIFKVLSFYLLVYWVYVEARRRMRDSKRWGRG